MYLDRSPIVEKVSEYAKLHILGFISGWGDFSGEKNIVCNERNLKFEASKIRKVNCPIKFWS